MIFSHAVRQALVEPGMAKISVRFAMPAMARDCSVEVPISSKEHAENFAKPSTSRSNSGSSLRRLIAVGKPGSAGDQHHLHIIAGYPRRDPARMA
jgi:hypothetical protein